MCFKNLDFEMKHPILKFTYYEKASQFLKTLAILLTLSKYLTSDSKKNCDNPVSQIFESDVKQVVKGDSD